MGARARPLSTVDPLTVNLSSFFTSPVADLKQLLPAYSWVSDYQMFVWDSYMAQDYGLWVFPDPTLGGLFPALTSDEEFKAFFNIPSDWYDLGTPFPYGDGGN